MEAKGSRLTGAQTQAFVVPVSGWEKGKHPGVQTAFISVPLRAYKHTEVQHLATASISFASVDLVCNEEHCGALHRQLHMISSE